MLAGALADAAGGEEEEEEVAELSRRQGYMERSLLGDGLPDRPFFRHE